MYWRQKFYELSFSCCFISGNKSLTTTTRLYRGLGVITSQNTYTNFTTGSKKIIMLMVLMENSFISLLRNDSKQLIDRIG